MRYLALALAMAALTGAAFMWPAPWRLWTGLGFLVYVGVVVAGTRNSPPTGEGQGAAKAKSGSG